MFSGKTNAYVMVVEVLLMVVVVALMMLVVVMVALPVVVVVLLMVLVVAQCRGNGNWIDWLKRKGEGKEGNQSI